jgi:prepilin-type N-terminal cleavage/methylation domain-containing protein
MSKKKTIANWKLTRGFTMVELLVVFALIGFLTVTGVNTFFSYGRNQEYKTAVADVSHTLTLLRSRAISQVKPPVCGTARLDGYEFWYANSGTSYRSRVRCGGTYYVLETRSLPQNVTFTTSTTTFFKVSTGTIDAPRNIVLTGGGRTTTVRVETTGVISAQ